MSLEQAMLLLAGHLMTREGAAGELAERVRAGMLDAMLGHFPPDFPPDQQAVLAKYLRQAEPDEMYQRMLGRVIVHGADGTLKVRRQPGAHRATGAYYTRETVVRYMAQRAKDLCPAAATAVDPACGAGAFLDGVRTAFGPALTRLVGMDADPLALSLAAERIPDAELHQADALLDEVPAGFDLCLGNPPYISSGLRGASRQDGQRAERLRERYPATAQYKLNTYPLFLERGLELLRPGGVLGYIVPDSFLSGRYFAGTRRLLLSCTILELTLIREDFWEHGSVGQSVILFVRKAPPPPNHQVEVKVCGRLDEVARTPAVRVPVRELVWGELDRFRLVPDHRLRELLTRMETRSHARLGAYLTSYSGLIGKKGQASLLASRVPGWTGLRGRLLRSGREIDRYQLRWAGEEVCLDPALIKSGGHVPYYQNPKILLRQTADSLRAVLDDQGFFCLNNIHLLAPKTPDVNLYALLALINSTPVDLYYRALTMESGRLYPQVDLDLLSSLPVPALSAEAMEKLERLARQRENAAPTGAALVEREIDSLVAKLYGLADYRKVLGR